MKQKIINAHKKIVWLELLLLTVWIFLMQTYIAPSSFIADIEFMLGNPLLILLNALPVCVILLVIYAISANSFISGAVTNVIFGLLSYTNLLKIDGRDDPFVPGDIALLREALQATGEYRLDMHYGIVALIVLSSVLMLALGLYLGRSEKRKKRIRIIAAVLAVIIFAAAFFTLYDDKDIYAGFPVSNVYNVTTIFNELGFNYCFLHNVNLYSAEKPDSYSAEDVGKWEDSYAVSVEKDMQPQVLMIMCEAFSDLNSNEVFTYSDDEHPMKSYYEVCEQPNSITGSVVTPNFGAGTANMEFDVIAGMQTNLINETSNSAMRSFFKDIPTAATVFADTGYDTFYLHPGYSWFYNRDSALSHMGIKDKVFIDDFEDTSGLDSVFLDKLKAELSKRTANGEKLFTYSTTMQNHQAYNYAKYSFDIPKVQTSASLSPEAEEYLSVYTYGIKCSSDMLKELTDYLNTLSEPYVLVFFGDHLPNLGPDYLSYRELGLDTGKAENPEQVLDTCTVPFLIWVNDAYMNGRSADEVFKGLDLPKDGRISACFLGELALEMAGREKADPYFSFLAELRRTLPIIKTGIVGTPDGVLNAAPSDEQLALVDKLHCWQYFRMTSD